MRVGIDAVDDLLRSSIVLGVSALDRFVHEKVVGGIVSALRETKLNRTQEEFSIPAALTLQTTKTLEQASRQGKTLRPANEVRNKIREILHKRPFQSWREIEFVRQHQKIDRESEQCISGKHLFRGSSVRGLHPGR